LRRRRRHSPSAAEVPTRVFDVAGVLVGLPLVHGPVPVAAVAPVELVEELLPVGVAGEPEPVLVAVTRSQQVRAVVVDGPC